MAPLPECSSGMRVKGRNSGVVARPRHRGGPAHRYADAMPSAPNLQQPAATSDENGHQQQRLLLRRFPRGFRSPFPLARLRR